MPKRRKSDSEVELSDDDDEHEEIKTNSIPKRRTRVNEGSESPEVEVPAPLGLDLRLAKFWREKQEEANKSVMQLKNTSLPVARIKRLMKLDEDVQDLDLVCIQSIINN